MQPVLHTYTDWIGTPAFSTTRVGGCSVGNYAAFNINAYCGDDSAHLSANRKTLCKMLHITENKLIMPHQTHSTEVMTIDRDFLALAATERILRLEGKDALITSDTDVCIGVSTADCIPVLLYDAHENVAASIHAGWRGTVGRIVEKTVRKMQHECCVKPQNVRAVIGPGISIGAFEVGDEVYDTFVDSHFPMSQIARRFPASDSAGEKWHIDLFEANRLQLVHVGIAAENILVSGICTYQYNETFFSARRLTINSGRIFTGILLRG